jgi:hypothetical protein
MNESVAVEMAFTHAVLTYPVLAYPGRRSVRGPGDLQGRRVPVAATIVGAPCASRVVDHLRAHFWVRGRSNEPLSACVQLDVVAAAGVTSQNIASGTDPSASISPATATPTSDGLLVMAEYDANAPAARTLKYTPRR